MTMLSVKNIARNIGLNEEIEVGTYVYQVATGKMVPVILVWSAYDERFETLADAGIIWKRLRRYIHGGVIHINGRYSDYTEEVNFKTFMAACREVGAKAAGIKVIRTAKQLNAA